MPLDDETTLICEINVPPDNFTWRFYPILDSSKPNEPLNLGTARYVEIPHSNYTHEKGISSLVVNVTNHTYTRKKHFLFIPF